MMMVMLFLVEAPTVTTMLVTMTMILISFELIFRWGNNNFRHGSMPTITTTTTATMMSIPDCLYIPDDGTYYCDDDGDGYLAALTTDKNDDQYYRAP